MQYLAVVLVAAATFGVCYLFDKGFVKLFRNKVQHRSGRSVRLSRHYAVMGLVLIVVGIAAIISGNANGMVMIIGGAVVVLLGACLIIYYMTFGIFYDDDGFILTTFGKRSVTYQYRDITMQQLYLVQGGNVIVELYLRDGRTVNLQSGMEGTYPFLDHAFKHWCRQTGRDPEQCPFHDPSQSLWFPMEVEG